MPEVLSRILAILNQLWDGVDIATKKCASEFFTVYGAGFTISFMVQEATLPNLFDWSGGLVRGAGFLASFLVA